MAAKKTPAPKLELPPDVTAADLKYPEYPEYDTPEYEAFLAARRGDHGGQLVFYHVPAGRKAPEWVLTTLRIGGAGKRGTTERFYGIGVADGKVYTVGKGPHVTAVVTVHLSYKNIERLRKYVELWEKGMAYAGAIRDRISTRRARGQAYRAEGRTSWMW